MGQLSLLNIDGHNSSAPAGDEVPGVYVVLDFISPTEEQRLLELIDGEVDGPWSAELKRRVQHYGFRYDYRARALDREAYLGKLPSWANELADVLVDCGAFPIKPDQVIVNEYLPGQGISPHIDRASCFDDTVASVSLGSRSTMEFNQPDSKKHVSVELPRRSLIVLTGPARYSWLHSIASRSSDKLGNQYYKRGRRVSLTFRKAVLADD